MKVSIMWSPPLHILFIFLNDTDVFQSFSTSVFSRFRKEFALGPVGLILKVAELERGYSISEEGYNMRR
jgi:hypothetical protein